MQSLKFFTMPVLFSLKFNIIMEVNIALFILTLFAYGERSFNFVNTAAGINQIMTIEKVLQKREIKWV